MSGESIEVHTIDGKTLESGVDADWVDLSWDRNSTGGTARLSVILKNEPGALAAVANIFGANKANILNLQLSNREGPFHTRSEEHTSELQSLMRITYAVFCLQNKKINKHITVLTQH